MSGEERFVTGEFLRANDAILRLFDDFVDQQKRFAVRDSGVDGVEVGHTKFSVFSLQFSYRPLLSFYCPHFIHQSLKDPESITSSASHLQVPHGIRRKCHERLS